MKKIRVAFIGLNEHSHSTPVYNRIRKMTDCFAVAGYVLPEGEREKYPNKLQCLESLQELTLEQILTDETIEAVIIETDEVHLTKYALLAAKHGKHIHMEKPGGVCLADFEELIGIMKKTGKVFHTGYMYRYNPQIRQVIEQVKAGELGQIISMEAQMNCIHPPETRQWLEAFPGGMMFFLGCHLIDLVLLIQGVPERIVPFNCAIGAESVTATDFGMAVLQYKNGASFVKTCARELGGYARRQLVVTGTKATLELKPLEVKNGIEITTPTTCYTSAEWKDNGVQSVLPPQSRYETMLRSFAQYVAGEKENPYTYDYELELFRTILKCCGGNV